MLPALQSPVIRIITPSEQPGHDLRWLDYFDPQSALRSVINHVETLPGSRHERHTMRAYLSSLANFCAYLGANVCHDGAEVYDFDFSTMTMPTSASASDYIAHCKRGGLSSATVTRYMAAARHFLRALEAQPVHLENAQDFLYVMEAQRQFRLALGVKNPPSDRKSNRPALEQYGVRLSINQVNTLFDSFQDEMHTLTGKRDLALIYLGLTSALRGSEIARLTLNNIVPGEDCYEVHVRGKGSNYDPIPIDTDAYNLILQYVNAWNARLEASDPRWIRPDAPLFRPLIVGDHIPNLNHPKLRPAVGVGRKSVLNIVKRRSIAVLGNNVSAHDMRRTCAYLMRNFGYEWDQIRAQLRHRSIATTEKYVGQKQDLSKSLLSKRAHFTLPSPRSGEGVGMTGGEV